MRRITVVLLVVAFAVSEGLSLPLTEIPSRAELDICNSEPHLEIIRAPEGARLCNSTTRRLLLDVHKLHGNPYHSLYDTAWAVSHYLRSCLRAPYTEHGRQHTHMYLKTNYPMDMKRCEVEPVLYNRWKQPSWGACVLRAAALHENIPDSNIIVGPGDPPDCFHDRIVFFARFRSLKYRIDHFNATGMQSTRKRKRKKKKKLIKQYLPSEERNRALRNLAEAPFLVHHDKTRAQR